MNQIRLITAVTANFRYERISQLNDLLAKLRAAHDKLLDEKRAELSEIVRQCLEKIHTQPEEYPLAKDISNAADEFFSQKKQQIKSCTKIALLDSLVLQLWQHADKVIEKMEVFSRPPADKPAPPKKENIRPLQRQYIFPAKTLRTEGEIDSYVEKIRTNMKQLLEGHDGIKIS